MSVTLNTMIAKDLFNACVDGGASVLGKFENDRGQRLRFYEHPIGGEDCPIIVAFIDYGVAFNSTFFDLHDMTQKNCDVVSVETCVKFGFDPNADADYVPRYVDGYMFCKYEENED
jgi:hypothetical protein